MRTGERFQGVDSSLDELVLFGTKAAQNALEESHCFALSEAALSELALRALRQVSECVLCLNCLLFS